MRSATFGILTVLHLRWWLTLSGDFHFQFCLVFSDIWHDLLHCFTLCSVVSSPDPLAGLCPWTPLGDFHPQTPLLWSPKKNNKHDFTKGVAGGAYGVFYGGGGGRNVKLRRCPDPPYFTIALRHCVVTAVVMTGTRLRLDGCSTGI